MSLPTAKWRPLIAEACRYASPVPEDVFEAMVLTESNGDPNVRSKSDARGLAQIMPKWHADVLGRKVAADLKVDLTDDIWFDPKFSLFAGARLLKGNYGECGSWTSAVRKYHSGSCNPPPGFKDGQGTSSEQHITKYLANLVRVQEDRAASSPTPAPPPTETPPMTFTAHTFPGLSKPVYIPSDIKVSVDLVPSSRSNIRSNTKRSASQVTKYTQHETANFNAGANARMHRNYLHGGAGGAYVGFNSVSDDKEIIILTPYDEVTWAAGTQEGNLVSDHAELCVHEGINHTRARQIAARLAAGVMHARGVTRDKLRAWLVQHNVWFGKNCPLLLRRDGLWPWFVDLVITYFDEIVAHVKGGTKPTPTPTPTPTTYAEPVPVAGMAELYEFVKKSGQQITIVNKKVKTIRATPRYQVAGKDTRIGPDVAPGSTFDVMAQYTDWSTKTEWYITPYWTRIRAADTEAVK